MAALTRTERKKAELRREIIDAAIDCFAEHGYQGTGIADIAARIGIANGTLYLYFANKRALLDEVITDLIESVTASLTAENAPDAVDTLADYQRQVTRIGAALTDILMADQRRLRVLLLVAAGADIELGQRILGIFDILANLTAAYLAHGVECGYLRADIDVANTAVAINGMVLGALYRELHSPGSPADHAALSTAIQQLMYHGIAISPR